MLLGTELYAGATFRGQNYSGGRTIHVGGRTIISGAELYSAHSGGRTILRGQNYTGGRTIPSPQAPNHRVRGITVGCLRHTFPSQAAAKICISGLGNDTWLVESPPILFVEGTIHFQGIL